MSGFIGATTPCYSKDTVLFTPINTLISISRIFGFPECTGMYPENIKVPEFNGIIEFVPFFHGFKKKFEDLFGSVQNKTWKLLGEAFDEDGFGQIHPHFIKSLSNACLIESAHLSTISHNLIF